jgi:RimJ/RimL family protein N-acetyltransferase
MSHLSLAEAAFMVRPIGPEDRDALHDAFMRLSPESRMRRFLSPKPKLSQRELTYLTDIDHVSHEAIGAFDEDGRMVAIARYATVAPEDREAEIAVTVVDEWQRRGLGTALAAKIVAAARDNAFTRLTASTLGENRPALALLRRLGFRPSGSSSGVLEFQLPLET